MNFGHIFHDKEDLSIKLTSIQDDIQQDGYNKLNREGELANLSNLHNIIRKEEKFWRQ